MNWLLERFRRSRGRSTIVGCYLRENGPIAYELPLFGGSDRERVDAMLESGLSWYWNVLGGESREWVELTAWSAAALLSNLTYQENDRHLLMIGIEPQDGRMEITDHVGGWTKRFAVDDRSSLHVVIDRRGGRRELVFVAQQPPENVRLLLQKWGIDRAKAERRAYPQLRERSLESLFEHLRG